MLRDITLGQYYPADSVIHKLDPRVKLMATLVYIMSLFTFRGAAGFILATVFMIVVITLIKSAIFLYGKGFKDSHYLNGDHGCIQSVFNTGRRSISTLLEIDDHNGRSEKCSIYVSPADLSDRRNFRYDTDYDTEPADRRVRKSTDAIVKIKSAGTCDRNDDVDRSAFYTYFNRRNRYHYESTDGKRC